MNATVITEHAFFQRDKQLAVGFGLFNFKILANFWTKLMQKCFD